MRTGAGDPKQQGWSAPASPFPQVWDCPAKVTLWRATVSHHATDQLECPQSTNVGLDPATYGVPESPGLLVDMFT